MGLMVVCYVLVTCYCGLVLLFLLKQIRTALLYTAFCHYYEINLSLLSQIMDKTNIKARENKCVLSNKFID